MVGVIPEPPPFPTDVVDKKMGTATRDEKIEIEAVCLSTIFIGLWYIFKTYETVYYGVLTIFKRCQLRVRVLSTAPTIYSPPRPKPCVCTHTQCEN